MSKLQLIDAKTMEKLLFKEGFQKTRQKGSHVFYRHADGRTTTVPFHSSKNIARPLIRQIIAEIVSLLRGCHPWQLLNTEGVRLLANNASA